MTRWFRRRRAANKLAAPVAAGAAAILALLAAGAIQAQQPAANAPAPKGAPAPTPQQQAAVARANAELILTLVRTTLVALHQANVTGNYSVLRDLGSPSFQSANSPTRLAEIFAGVRRLNIDLSAVVLLDPQISRATLTDAKMLHVVGALATQPYPVRFELLFQPINGVWRINGVSMAPVQPEASSAAPAKPAAAPKQEPASAGGRKTQ
jgi:hypothetical protein